MLFGKISYFIAFLLWIGKLELLHCQYILSGFCSYVFFVYSYFYLSSTLWPLHFFLSKLIVLSVLYLRHTSVFEVGLVVKKIF